MLRLIAFLLAVAPAAAHDLWLVPPEKAKPGEPVAVRAVSGTKFPNGETPPDPAKFAARVGRSPDGTTFDIMAGGTDGDAGLLTFTPPAAGVYAFGVRTTPKVLAMAAADFNAYLVADGLPHVYRLRVKEKTLDADATERYSKSPKVLVKVGDGGAGDPCQPLGLPLEIVPRSDPFARKVGETLKVRVLMDGKPLAGVRLGWDHPGGDPDEPAGTVRTDEAGEALVPLAKPGLMTIRLTHMTRPKAADHEWESFWTTLTFRLPG